MVRLIVHFLFLLHNLYIDLSIGLKQAFLARPEFGQVHVFYPLDYARLFDHPWDLVIIEGWFPAIDDFTQMIRIHGKHTVLFFFCLDPVYPGLDMVSQLNIDGVLTNSIAVMNSLKPILPVQFVMLAADPIHMAPDPNVSKDWGAVYVGAGGGMTRYKYMLMDMLRHAKPSGLRLHGSHWDEILEFREVWKGALERERIPEAYSSAHTVLASTTDEQRSSGMINNRIFEALACGAVVVSEPNPAVINIFGDIVISIQNGSEVETIISTVLNSANSDTIESLRRRGRAEIVQKHTWHHRVVDILDMFYHYRWSQSFPRNDMHSFLNNKITNKVDETCMRRPQLAWIVSNAVQLLADYLVVSRHVLTVVEKYYCVTIFSEEEWEFIATSDERKQFTVLLANIVFLDNLDAKFEREGPTLIELSRGYGVQKVIAYIYGVNIERAEMFSRRFLSKNKYDHYDVIWYRSQMDLNLIESTAGITFSPSRIQHVFGISDNPSESTIEESLGFRTVLEESEENSSSTADFGENSALRIVVVCSIYNVEECTAEEVNAYTAERPYILLLFGGKWADWVKTCKLFNIDIHNLDETTVSKYLSLISRSVHIPDERVGDAEAYISNADEAIFMLESDISTPIENSLSPYRSSIWYLVAAAVGGTRIRLTRVDQRAFRLIDEGISTWNVRNLEKQVRLGIARLVGMNSQKADLSMNIPQNGSIWVPRSQISSKLVIDAYFSGIMLGRDGQCCILFNGGSKLCALRTAKRIEVSLNWEDYFVDIYIASQMVRDVWLHSSMKDTCPSLHGDSYISALYYAELDIKLMLHGTIFSESTHTTELDTFVPVFLKHYCTFEDSIFKSDIELPKNEILQASVKLK